MRPVCHHAQKIPNKPQNKDIDHELHNTVWYRFSSYAFFNTVSHMGMIETWSGLELQMQYECRPRE